jgi:hypothetical protein
MEAEHDARPRRVPERLLRKADRLYPSVKTAAAAKSPAAKAALKPLPARGYVVIQDGDGRTVRTWRGAQKARPGSRPWYGLEPPLVVDAAEVVAWVATQHRHRTRLTKDQCARIAALLNQFFYVGLSYAKVRKATRAGAAIQA